VKLITATRSKDQNKITQGPSDPRSDGSSKQYIIRKGKQHAYDQTENQLEPLDLRSNGLKGKSYGSV